MKSIFVNHTLAEFFNIIYFLTDEERNSVNSAYYATVDESDIKLLAELVFPNLKHQSTVVSKLNIKAKVNRNEVNVLPMNLIDIDADVIKHEALSYSRIFNLNFKFPNFTNTRIPKYKYAVISSETFNANDDIECVNFLKNAGLIGVVLNDNKHFGCLNERIVDYTAQYKFIQKINLVKNATAFYGEASLLAVVASKFLPSTSLCIPKLDNLYVGEERFWFAPREWPLPNISARQAEPVVEFAGIPRIS